MGTGITSVLLHQLPYQFNGLREISMAIYFLNILLFTIFLLVSIARYVIWPQVFKTMLFHPQQSLFLGTLSMGFSTIVTMTVLVAVPAFGQKMAYVAWAMWFVNVIVSVMIATVVPFVMFTRHDQTFSSINAAWLMPILGPLVAAASGGIVATVLPEEHARLTIILSYVLWFPTLISMMIMALLYARLAIHKVPAPEAVVSVFLPVGPCGQGAFVLLQLAEVTRQLTKSTGVWLGGGSIYSAEEAVMMATAVHGVTICASFVLWGLGFFWFAIAIMTLVDMARKKTIPFNMGWWGFTFPLGVHASATIAFATQLDSGFFRVLGTVQALSVTILWIYIVGMTAVRAWNGSLFVAPCLGPTGQPPKASPKRS